MKHGCTVFVGNIDFDIDDRRVMKELSTVGKVVSFRMMYDKNTGKSKGYGFCEYESPLIAEMAMKTLKISFNGRPVKINYAENDMPQKTKDTETRGIQIDNILAVLDSMDQNNLRDVIDYLKKMATTQPSQLKELLDRTPSLVIAILTVLVQLDLVERQRVEELIESSFDLDKQKEQVVDRIAGMNEQDLDELSEDLKNRIVKLKGILTKTEIK